MSPTSIASPPRVVTSSAWVAARREARSVSSSPMSRYEQTVVSSQKTYSTMTSSARTMPAIAPAKATNVAANRPARARSAYQAV